MPTTHGPDALAELLRERRDVPGLHQVTGGGLEAHRAGRVPFPFGWRLDGPWRRSGAAERPRFRRCSAGHASTVGTSAAAASESRQGCAGC